MKLVRTVATAVAMSVIAGAALSAPLKLQPANPQPSPKAGLNVKYFGTGNQHKKIRDLSQAKSMLSKAKPGKPLRGLDYRDTSKGEDVLTFDQAYNVAAEVTGYMRFDSPGVYELGGPDVETFRELMQGMLAAIYRRRLILNLPFFAANILAGVLDFASAVTVGLFKNGILTKDQVKSLKQDNVVSESAKGLADLGIKPTAYPAVIREYLWRFRPQGQYDDITASGKNLKV